MSEYIKKSWKIEEITKDSLPNYLKTNAKLEYLKKFKNNKLTLDELIDFLRYQTSGTDWQNFDILIHHFDLKFDNNDMIIFTDEFPFDSRIKKEALFNWWILRVIHKNSFISKYPDKLKSETQGKLEEYLLSINENMRIDLCFTKLKMAIEVNEIHHTA